MKNDESKYCCMRLFLAVEEEKCINQSLGEIDETEWFIKECMHIYFCPFCGSNIKGSGFGSYDVCEERIKFDEKIRKKYNI